MTLMQAKGLLAAAPSLASKKRHPQEGATWLIADLVDTGSGKPFNTLWRHSTKKAIFVDESKKGKGKDTTGRSFVIRNPDEPEWGDSFQWMDISVPFEKAAIRVRLFYTDKNDDDLCLGKVVVPLEDLEQKMKDNGLPAVGESLEMVEMGHGGETQAEGWYELKTGSSTPGGPNARIENKDFAKMASGTLTGAAVQLRAAVKRPDQKPKKGTNHLRQLSHADRASQESMGSKLDVLPPPPGASPPARTKKPPAKK